MGSPGVSTVWLMVSPRSVPGPLAGPGRQEGWCSSVSPVWEPDMVRIHRAGKMQKTETDSALRVDEMF
ncbi:hypothetical protein GCM10009696_05560 [Kocuria himachalensis]